MGASGWSEYTAFGHDLPALLRGVQQRVFAAEEYYWDEFWEEEGVERPATLEGLFALFEDEEYEDIASQGTHSILDVYQVKPAGSAHEFGTLVALSDQQVLAVFGTSAPTKAQFEAAYPGGFDGIADFPRWSGLCTTIYDHDEPTEIVFWGESGD